MRILYLCQRVPFPPDRGDKIAAHHAIQSLRGRHSVCVATLADSEEELRHVAALRELGFEVLVARQSIAQRLWSVLGALRSNTPLSVAYYRSEELAEQIRRAATGVGFDAVVAFSSSMAQYSPSLPDVPLVADFVDLDSQKWALYGAHRAWPQSWLFREEARRLLAFERGVSARARCVLVCTKAEREDYRRLISAERCEVLANGVDADYFRASGPKPTATEIVFTGVMDYFPNVEGVRFFCSEVWPLIRRRIPTATFTIVGAHPSRSVRHLAAVPGVSVTGRVPDVRPFLHRARLAVVPLRLARGVQNKVLEALAMETPVVMTSAVRRGIDASDGDGFTVADDPHEIAERTLTLLEDYDRAVALGRRGRAMIERRYVWSENLGVLERVLAEVTGSTPSGRAVAASRA